MEQDRAVQIYGTLFILMRRTKRLLRSEMILFEVIVTKYLYKYFKN